MNAYELSGEESGESGYKRRGIEAVAKRVHRALDSFFHVEPASDNGKFEVFSGSGETYSVDVSDGSCTCPDGQRGSWCKHAYRVAFVTGEIPDIDGVRVESEADTSGDTDTNEDTTDTENDDSETLTERVERFGRNNPGASAIEAISQLGISPDQKEQVEEVLA